MINIYDINYSSKLLVSKVLSTFDFIYIIFDKGSVDQFLEQTRLQEYRQILVNQV